MTLQRGKERRGGTREGKRESMRKGYEREKREREEECDNKDAELGDDS